ncbi:MAG: hypothetical protein HUJ95_05525, partial [Bacteroidales bacterium]|nr:hypothetical protein [Bacteroidales bacterium]
MIDYEILKAIDKNILPGENFAKYASGKWIQHNPKPSDYPDWGPFMKVADTNVHRIASLIQRCAD